MDSYEFIQNSIGSQEQQKNFFFSTTEKKNLNIVFHDINFFKAQSSKLIYALV